MVSRQKEPELRFRIILLLVSSTASSTFRQPPCAAVATSRPVLRPTCLLPNHYVVGACHCSISSKQTIRKWKKRLSLKTLDSRRAEDEASRSLRSGYPQKTLRALNFGPAIVSQVVELHGLVAPVSLCLRVAQCNRT